MLKPVLRRPIRRLEPTGGYDRSLSPDSAPDSFGDSNLLEFDDDMDELDTEGLREPQADNDEAVEEDQTSDDEEVYCYCDGYLEDDMVECSNSSDCPLQWVSTSRPFRDWAV